ncbi:olfactory receptor 14L1-like [Passerculus sandwichensis]
MINADTNRETVDSVANNLRNYESVINGPMQAHVFVPCAVACGHHLHTPMFFFLLNLALSDLGSICTTVPKAMHNSLWDTRNISYSGCATQVFFFVFYATAQLALLTIMCYDRYVSICKPLFSAVLRIPSEQGRHKAFSTCLPHLAVLSLFISTAAFAHLKPSSMSSPSLDMALQGGRSSGAGASLCVSPVPLSLPVLSLRGSARRLLEDRSCSSSEPGREKLFAGLNKTELAEPNRSPR